MNTHSETVQENKSRQMQNVTPQNQGGNTTFLPFVDNRPEAIQMRKLQALANQNPVKKFNGSSSKDPVQRLIIAVGDPVKMDFAVSIDLAFHHKQIGGKIISLNDLSEPAAGAAPISIDDGEIIVVTAHGTQGKIDGMNASEVASYLTKIGNYKKTGGVFISSCYSATPTAKDQQDSVVDITQVLLNMGMEEEGAKPSFIPVYGTNGLAAVDFSMITGDLCVKYKIGFGRIADLIGKLIMSRMDEHYTTVKKNTVMGVYAHGAEVIGANRYQPYNEKIMRALTGDLSTEESMLLVRDLMGQIELQAMEFQKLRQSVEAVRKETAAASANPGSATNSGAAAVAAVPAHSGAAAPAAGAGAAAIPAELAQKLSVIEQYLADAKEVIKFIQWNTAKRKSQSLVAEPNNGEPSLSGYDANGKPHETTYTKLIKNKTP